MIERPPWILYQEGRSRWHSDDELNCRENVCFHGRKVEEHQDPFKAVKRTVTGEQ
jgi:hypothetical protein